MYYEVLMKKKNIVKNSEDFTRIISKKQGVVNNYFIINILVDLT